jgi:hypothetical protein
MDPIHDNFFVQDSANLAESLVRETLQNSLDAQVDEVTPVRVRFALNDVPVAKHEVFKRFIADLYPHLDASKPLLAKACRVAMPQFLVIEDFGTKGLMGETVSNRDTKSGFSNFWRHVGKTEKGSGRGGAFGIGKVVVPMSSSACAFFGVTIRYQGPDSGIPLLMGQSMLPQRTVNGKEYEPFVLYGQKSATGKAVLPIQDKECDALSKLAGLTRTTEPGTSIAIPFPSGKVEWEQVFKAVMKHYYLPILTEDLVVEYVKESGGSPVVIDKAGLIENASKVSSDFTHQVKFVQEAIAKPDSAFFTISGKDTNQEITAARFSEDELLALRKRYSENNLLCFKLQVYVRPKSGEAAFFPLKLFIRKAPDGVEGADLYVRGGISVYSNATYKGQRASLALEIVQEKNHLGELLRLSEGPAHSQWVISSPRAADAYHDSNSAIKLCRTALLKLHEILCVGEEKEDVSALASFFPLGMPELPKKSAPFKITSDNIGDVFVRNSSEPGSPSVIGIPFTVKIRYEKVGRGRGYSRSDFILGAGAGEIKVRAKNAAFTYDAVGNSVTLTPSAEDFELKVGPFDTNRNLDVRANFTK